MGAKPKYTGYWLFIVTDMSWHMKRLCFHPQLNFDALFEKQVWGLNKQRSVDSIRPGDSIVIYVGGGYSAIAGCAIAATKWKTFKGREQDEFVDVRIQQPMKSGIRLTKLLRVRFPTQVPLIQLSEKLEFCGYKKEFKEHLQKNLRAISQDDFETIIKAAFELNPKFRHWYGTGTKLIRSFKRQSRIAAQKAKTRPT